MKEFVISEVKAETAVLVGLITQQQDEAKTKEYLDELEFLADTAGAVTIKRFRRRCHRLAVRLGRGVAAMWQGTVAGGSRPVSRLPAMDAEYG